MKRSFLAVDDYGMGGIWMYIDALSPEEIERAYPELKVFPDPPDFLTPEEGTVAWYLSLRLRAA
ncbi:MAG: hypothetical protein QOC92_101 [Acidimicrobiaceae bacterium]|jgi:hypothetical protein